MSLRAKFTVYLAVLHVALAALAVALFWNDRVWIFAVEAAVVVSLLAGVRLVRSVLVPLELVRSGAQYIAERDFTVRFREAGQPELDQLVSIYNRMVDHLRQERTLTQEQHYFLDKILTASPSGVVILDYEERVAIANPAVERLLGRPAAELEGRRLSEIDDPLARALDRLAVDESRVEPVWGSRRVRCRRLQFLDRGFSRSFFVVDELTEELRRSERAAYEKLIRVMSHEVNNTVAATSSLLHSCLTYAARLEGEEREDFEGALEVVISRTEQLNAFMRGFADVVRLPAPQRQMVDVHGLLEGIARLMRAECERRRIRWAWACDEPPGRVAMDAAQMEQVFLNVVKNAVEAIGEDGTITVRCGRSSNRPFVAVEDTGAGIPADVRANLFTPFFSTKENGQGIGLTMVQEILGAHGFAFSLESAPPGPTRFTVYF